jgi:NADH:ubiquinone oxidoreductase subunit 6 (subunit J)
MVSYMLLKVNLVTLLVGALVIFLAAIEIGFRLGKRRQDNSDEPDKSHTNALQGATLGLLALLLGFTFAMSVSRFDHRKTAITEQANAIGTAELRSRLLGTPYAEKAAPLFRGYVQSWLDYRAATIDDEALAAAERRAFAIEDELWSIVREATAADPHSLPASLFAAAMNDVIDMHERRVRSVEDRVPDPVIFLLFAVSVLALGQVAYSSGLRGRRNEMANVTFAFVIALVLVIILDIDRPRRGLVQVSHESMLRLQQSLAPTPP